ncbi:MAG: amidohydrolase [Actinomycetota bacterium]|nr:MAG: amidohydrolase [Actinomycetota bacterium]
MDDPIVIVSSDGHAGALMADYRPYLDAAYREEFDDFLIEWNEHGSRNFDPPALRSRLDPADVEDWTAKMVDTGRLDGFPDPNRRLQEVEKEGICAEVLFPDFGIPFELYSRGIAATLGRTYTLADDGHRQAAFRAFNRWLMDYVSAAPERFVGTAVVSWHDVDAALTDIRAAHAGGLRAIVLPEFSGARPLYHHSFEPIWNLIEELGLIVSSHAGISSTSNQQVGATEVAHPAMAARLWMPELMFRVHNILTHLIWGGVLERHPTMKVVFTEQGSGWVVPQLADMDYSYEGSYFRSDYKDLIRSKPSEYFRRQCYLGSSLFSRAEISARRTIGLDKMMLGMDFPHHEGTLVHSTQEYLRATLGAAGVPLEEARLMLGLTAAEVYGFDLERLVPVAARLGLQPDQILSEPDYELYPRGDVHRPAVLAI